MPMTLRNELFQHTAYFRKFAILVGLRQDAQLKEELYFHFKGQTEQNSYDDLYIMNLITYKCICSNVYSVNKKLFNREFI